MAGNLEAVRRIVDEAYARMSHSPIDASVAYAYAHADARSAWLRGDRPRLDQVVSLRASANRPEEEVVRARARVMVARMDQRGLDEAVDDLAAAERAQRELRAWFGTGLPGLERATILHERGRTWHALEAAEATLDAAAELGAGILLADASSHVPLLRRCVAEDLHARTVGPVLAALDRPTVRRCMVATIATTKGPAMTVSMPPAERIDPAEVLPTLVAALADDPLWRWLSSLQDSAPGS